MRIVSAGKLATGTVGEVTFVSLGKAKCELDANRIGCVQSSTGVGTSACFPWTACQDKGHHIFSSFLSFHLDFHISSFILPFLFLLFFCSFFLSLERCTHNSLGWPPSMYLRLVLNFSSLPSPSKYCDSEGPIVIWTPAHPACDFVSTLLFSYVSHFSNSKGDMRQTPRREKAESLL